jgi:hypothetical protein
MVRERPAPHDGAVPRLLVLWSRPRHVSSEEAQLTRIASASVRHGSEWSWLLELEVADPVDQFVKRRPCADWLGDMRLLGMQPRVMVAADAVELDPGRD